VLFGVTLSASARPASPALSTFGPWATFGPRIAFVGTVAGRTAIWVEQFGATQPALLGPAACVKQEETDELAPGPNGTWACLERTVGNTEAFYSVDVASRSGVSKEVATAGVLAVGGNASSESIPFVFGDGSFLGYLHLTVSGPGQLMRITSAGRAEHVADLAGIDTPEAIAIASGHLAILQPASVSVYTTGGQQVTTVTARAASIALTSDRVVLRTRDGHLAVYTLRGKLVHSYPLGARTGFPDLAAYGGYAVYLAGGKTVRAVALATGTNRIVARAGTGSFYSGLSLQAPGAVLPLTTPRGTVTLRFLPLSTLKAIVSR
jgi:hypothetical protein